MSRGMQSHAWHVFMFMELIMFMVFMVLIHLLSELYVVLIICCRRRKVRASAASCRGS